MAILEVIQLFPADTRQSKRIDVLRHLVAMRGRGDPFSSDQVHQRNARVSRCYFAIRPCRPSTPFTSAPIMSTRLTVTSSSLISGEPYSVQYSARWYWHSSDMHTFVFPVYLSHSQMWESFCHTVIIWSCHRICGRWWHFPPAPRFFISPITFLSLLKTFLLSLATVSRQRRHLLFSGR